MLSWMRWLTSWFWNIVNSKGAGNGFTGWFADNWLGLAIFLIIVGAVVDWLVWMIRWRPYWLWLRKRQIIYEEVTVPKKRAKRSSAQKEQTAAADDFDDPFASAQESDPYAPPRSAVVPTDDLSDWDSTNDPYARQDDVHTDYDPRIYARPTLGDASKASSARRTRPVFGERMNHSNVDGRQKD